MVKSKNIVYGEITFCKKCNNEMPFTRENFVRKTINKTYPLGLGRICKNCRNEYERKRWNENLIVKEKYKKNYLTAKGIYNSYKARAKQKNRYFELTVKDFEEFWQANCYYCGTKLMTVGFDRIDSSKGYMKNNIVPSCNICNKMKMDRSQKEFLNYCKLIVDNHFKEG